MKMAMLALFLVCVFLGILPSTADACTVCMGANGTMGEAANGAIFVMLGVLGSVLSLIVLAGYSVVKRSRGPLPPHAELARAMSASNLK
jgi:flagellar biogenesis protein FliO